jgi:hypothetical protein
LNCHNLWTLASSVKGREVEFSISYNMIGGNDSLSTFGHSVERP